MKKTYSKEDMEFMKEMSQTVSRFPKKKSIPPSVDPERMERLIQSVMKDRGINRQQAEAAVYNPF